MKLTDKLLTESETKTIKITRKSVSSLIYPKGTLVTSGTDPMVGAWVVSGGWRGKPVQPGVVNISFGSESNGMTGMSMTFPVEKESAVRQYLAKARAAGDAAASTAATGVEAKAAALWDSQGPFMTNEVGNTQDSASSRVVAAELTRLGYSQRKLPLFKPVILWFKR